MNNNNSNKKYKPSESSSEAASGGYNTEQLHIKTEKNNGYELDYNQDNNSPGKFILFSLM
jgi:hypothetical protein